MANWARLRRKTRNRKPRLRMRAGLIVGGSVLVVVALLFVDLVDSVTHPIIDSSNVAQVEHGRSIYMDACASCHGISLEGQPEWQTRSLDGRLRAPPLGAAGRAWRHTDRTLFSITKRGPAAYPVGYGTDMPAFDEKLTDQEIAAALAYIESTWPPAEAANHAARNLAFWKRPIH